MGIASHDAVKQLSTLMDQVDEAQKNTFQNMHQGYPTETMIRFLKAREWNAPKAHKMLVDCLNWRIQNEIDDILSKPIVPADLYRSVRDSQLIGLSGYSKEVHYYVQSHIQINEYRDRIVLPNATKKCGRHIGTCIKILDMTGLKLSAMSQIKLLTAISTVDDLNYPEKTDTYYIVNVPYIFSACWKVVKPLLQERTRRKVKVLQGCGRDELLKVMDYASLPHFCKREGSGSSRYSSDDEVNDCFSLDHPFHQQMYSYMKQQATGPDSVAPIKQGSFHVDVPEPALEDAKIVKKIESELHKISGERNGLTHTFSDLKIDAA